MVSFSCVEIPGVPEYVNQYFKIKIIDFVNRRFLEKTAIHQDNYLCFKLLVYTFFILDICAFA